MVEALDAKVRKLVRVAIGEIRIGDLQIGMFRALTREEIGRLTTERTKGTKRKR
jgi:16S rRNA U516 pseudouridylate synthase RsuA-like enzyme